MASVTPLARSRLISAPFVIVTVATLAFFTFVGIAVSTLPRFIEDELGGDGLAIGINLAVFSVAAIAARPMIARIGDRYGRRTLMVGGALTAGAAIAATAFVHSIAALLPLRALSGVGEAALFVGAATLIADLSPSERRAEGASYFSLAVFGGLGIGPVVGEVVLGDGRYRAVYLVAALCCLTAAAIALAAPNRVAGVATASVDGEGARGFHRAAFLPGLVLACGIGGFAAFNAFLPTHAEALGMHASVPFLVYSVLCLSLRFLGARLPERLGLGNALMAALVGLTSGLLLLAVLDHPSGVYVGTVVLALGMALLYPSLMAFAVNAVAEHERARVLASFTMFFEVGTVVGGLLLGSVARFGGERGAFAGGAVLACSGIWVLRTRLLPAARERRATVAAAPRFFDGGLEGGLAVGD
jgi:MFS family permease